MSIIEEVPLNVTTNRDIEDLALLACEAAVELDNLSLGKDGGLTAVSKLSQAITASLSSGGKATIMPDPTAVVVMKRAIGDANLAQGQLVTVIELQNEAGKIRQRLEEVFSNPEAFRTQRSNGLGKIKSFCLALSRHASAQKPSLYDRQPHQPYRR